MRVDLVVVAKTDGPDPGPREHHRRRATDAAHADDEHPRLRARHDATPGKYSSMLK